MVLISIDPFALRKALLVAIALLCLSVFCFADSLFMARQHGRVMRVRPAQTSAPGPDQMGPAPIAPSPVPIGPSWDVELSLLQPAPAFLSVGLTRPLLDFGSAGAE